MAKRTRRVVIHRPVVWVTGASSGIGREIARQFAFLGCEVALSARSTKNIRSAVAEIIDLGGRAHAFPCDTADGKSILRTVHAVKQQLGDIEVLVNNAGITVFKTFLCTTIQEFHDVLHTNLEGPIRCIKAVLPAMIRKRRGWIFNILSNAAIKTFEGSAAYTATKAGLLGLARVLREEVRSSHIKIVNVVPGATETAMWSKAMRTRHGHRMMKAISIAEAVLSVYQMPDDVVVDEIVLRPMMGDID